MCVGAFIAVQIDALQDCCCTKDDLQTELTFGAYLTRGARAAKSQSLLMQRCSAGLTERGSDELMDRLYDA